MQQNIITITSYKKSCAKQVLVFHLQRSDPGLCVGSPMLGGGRLQFCQIFRKSEWNTRKLWIAEGACVLCPHPDPIQTRQWFFLEPARIVFVCKARKCSVIVAPHGHCVFTKCTWKPESNVIAYIYFMWKINSNSTRQNWDLGIAKKIL